MVVAPAATDAPWSAAEMRAALPLDGAGAAISPRLRPNADRPAARAAAASGYARRLAKQAQAAKPVAGEQEAPLSAHGRIFFEKADTGLAYSCSGTVVRSRKRNLVFTAGHCVYDLAAGDFNQRITFVPAYRDGAAPFGQFVATYTLTSSGWIAGSGSGYDIGAILVDGPVQDLVGGRPVDFEFNPRPGSRFSIFGYPVLPAPPYTGEVPVVCRAAYVPGIVTGTRPSLAASPCDMEQGSSGGGWLTPAGYLISVVTHGYCDSRPDLCGVIFGPRLGVAGAKIYRRAGGSERPRLTIKRGPRGRITVRRARFSFAVDASTQVKLECRIVGPRSYPPARRGFRRCGRTATFTRLRPGRYALRVRLTDQAGRRAHLRRAFRLAR